jgi:hypothetical protein
MVSIFKTAAVHLVTTKEYKESWFAVSIMLHEANIHQLNIT